MIKILPLLFISTLLCSNHSYSDERPSAGIVLKVLARNFAKEFCSCYFVAGNDRNYCQDYASSLLKIKKYSINHREKIIRVKVGFYRTSSKYVSKKYGCVLESY